MTEQNKRAKKILIEAKALIDTPEKWTKGTYAKDRHGNPVGFLDHSAVCFCSYGALYKVGGEITDATEVLATVITALGYRGIAHYNDLKEHSDVMKAFDLAIEKAGE